MTFNYALILAAIQIAIIVWLAIKNIKTTNELVALKNKEYQFDKIMRLMDFSHRFSGSKANETFEHYTKQFKEKGLL